MHDDRDPLEARIVLDVLGQDITVHFRHLGVDKDEVDLVFPRPVWWAWAAMAWSRSRPRHAVGRVLVAPQACPGTSVIFAGDDGVVDTKN